LGIPARDQRLPVMSYYEINLVPEMKATPGLKDTTFPYCVAFKRTS